VLRKAPEAYRARQLRAITLADYIARAEEVPGVSRAVARYAWTGSWRTVRVVIDPENSIELDPVLRQAVADRLEAVRLIGEDIELRPPRFVPLDIEINVCIQPDFWPQDLRFVLEQEFSDGWTPDGRRGFFHPDEWTFGQALHRSQIAGRVHAVTGVEHLVSIAMKRRNNPAPAALNVEQSTMAFDEIVLVQNDPDHLEHDGGRDDDPEDREDGSHAEADEALLHAAEPTERRGRCSGAQRALKVKGPQARPVSSRTSAPVASFGVTVIAAPVTFTSA